jgi:hypothetical protein
MISGRACIAMSLAALVWSHGARAEDDVRVVKLKPPSDHVVSLTIDAGLLYGSALHGQFAATDVRTDIAGGGVHLGVQYRAGGDLPGWRGGTWSGVGIDLSAGASGGAIITRVDNGATSNGLLLFSGDAALGYQFYSFGRMHDDDLIARGVGVFVGARAGVANTRIYASDGTAQGTNPQYGPELQLSFPTYNFGSGKRDAVYLSFYVMPTGDFLFASCQLGGAFGL